MSQGSWKGVFEIDPPAIAVSGPLEIIQALSFVSTEPVDVGGLQKDLLPGIIPPLLAAVLASAAGECAGYATGRGRAAEKSVDLDMNTDDPVFSAARSAGGKVPNNNSIKAYDYFDVSFQWPATDYLSITGGINNVTDQDPPTLDTNIFGISSPPLGNGNTYPVVYDSMGRQVFISVSSKF